MTNCLRYDEKDLLRRIAAADEVAFREIFLHWHQLLAGYILRITESKDLTEEIVQDVFMKIWVARATMGDVNNFKHFLLIVGRNMAFDALKKQLKERAFKRAWEKENSFQSSIDNNNDEARVHSLMEQAIDELSPKRKEVYLLSRHRRLTYDEIASQLHISKETVKTHLKLASSSIAAFIRSHQHDIFILSAMSINFF